MASALHVASSDVLLTCIYIADEDEVMDLRVAFEESLQYISEGSFCSAAAHHITLDLTLFCCCDTAFPVSGDPFYRIEKYYAYISAKRLGDMDKAKEIWQQVVQQHGLNTEAWIDYIMFERDQGHYEKCESLFKQAIQKNIDNPARLISVWSSVEHEIGTLASYETSLVKINQKSKILARQWQAQSQRQAQHQPQQKQQKPELTEEQKTANAKEKKEMDRVSLFLISHGL